MIKLQMIAACMLFLLLSLCPAKANILSYQKTRDGVSFTLDKGQLFIHIVGDDVIEVKYSNLAVMPSKESLVVTKTGSFKRSFSVSEMNGAIIITTAKLKIKVDRKTNSISYYDLHNNEILSE